VVCVRSWPPSARLALDAPAAVGRRAEAIFPVVSPSTGELIGTIDAESDQKSAFTPDDDAFLSECAKVLLPLWLGLEP
jgi:putative methionine-R-sulfoxide reductase with GAF domain